MKLLRTLGGQSGIEGSTDIRGSGKIWRLREPWACELFAVGTVGLGGVSLCCERLETGEAGVDSERGVMSVGERS